jgi:hypothetical protein
MSQRIIYQTSEGVAVVIPTGELPIEAVLAKDVPAGVDAEVVDVSAIPSDRTFRNAWEKQGRAIGHNMAKVRSIAHDRRRAMRAEEFAPHDEVIAKQIPGKDAQVAESARQAIRNKYEAMQSAIDAATTPEAVKSILESQ